MLAILLVISCVFNAYSINQTCVKSQITTADAGGQGTTDAGNNSWNVHVPNRIDTSTYEQVGDELPYTDLNRSGVGEYNEHFNAHLNHGADVYVIEEETGI